MTTYFNEETQSCDNFEMCGICEEKDTCEERRENERFWQAIRYEALSCGRTLSFHRNSLISNSGTPGKTCGECGSKCSLNYGSPCFKNDD